MTTLNPLTPTVAIWVQQQSAQMSKITKRHGLARDASYGTHMTTVGVKGLIHWLQDKELRKLHLIDVDGICISVGGGGGRTQQRLLCV